MTIQELFAYIISKKTNVKDKHDITDEDIKEFIRTYGIRSLFSEDTGTGGLNTPEQGIAFYEKHKNEKSVIRNKVSYYELFIPVDAISYRSFIIDPNIIKP